MRVSTKCWRTYDATICMAGTLTTLYCYKTPALIYNPIFYRDPAYNRSFTVH